MRKKVTVLGAGNVGANCAVRIADKELADVVLVDVVAGVPQGKGLDLLQSGPVQGYDVNITGRQRLRAHGELRHRHHHRRLPAQARHEPRRFADGQFRSHQDRDRAGGQVLAELHHHRGDEPAGRDGAGCVQVSKFSKNRVIGMAGVLDSARFRTFIAQELNVSVENVTGVVMGGHGDTMVPLVRLSNVAGIPLTELMDQATIDAIVNRTAMAARRS